MSVKTKIIILFLAWVAAFVAAFSPDAQGIQRFRTILAQVVTVSKTLTTVDLAVSDDATVADDATVTGDLTVSGALSSTNVTLGSDYALATSSTGQGFECGTETITGTAFVATGLTTVTNVMAMIVTDPLTDSEAIVTYDAPTTSSVTINVWSTDAVTLTSEIVYNVGDVGVLVSWCAYGDR